MAVKEDVLVFDVGVFFWYTISFVIQLKSVFPTKMCKSVQKVQTNGRNLTVLVNLAVLKKLRGKIQEDPPMKKVTGLYVYHGHQ